MSVVFTIRPAADTQEDLSLLSRFCHELAEFDGHSATVTPEKLHASLFSGPTGIRAFLGFRGNEPIGFILAYECFTVYHGDRGLYVPGAYVIEKYRHRGYGVKMFRHLARYALDHGFGFMNWIVEENNEKANAIYKKMGAQVSGGWVYVRLPGEMLKKIGRHA